MPRCFDTMHSHRLDEERQFRHWQPTPFQCSRKEEMGLLPMDRIPLTGPTAHRVSPVDSYSGSRNVRLEAPEVRSPPHPASQN